MRMFRICACTHVRTFSANDFALVHMRLSERQAETEGTHRRNHLFNLVISYVELTQ